MKPISNGGWTEKDRSQPTVDALDEFPESVDLHLDARLGEGVVVLNAIQESRGAPEAVGLNDGPCLHAQLQQIAVLNLNVWRHTHKQQLSGFVDGIIQCASAIHLHHTAKNSRHLCQSAVFYTQTTLSAASQCQCFWQRHWKDIRRMHKTFRRPVIWHLFNFNDIVFLLQSFHPTTGHMWGLVIQTSVLFSFFIIIYIIYLFLLLLLFVAWNIYQPSTHGISLFKQTCKRCDLVTLMSSQSALALSPTFISSAENVKIRHVTLSLVNPTLTSSTQNVIVMWEMWPSHQLAPPLFHLLKI